MRRDCYQSNKSALYLLRVRIGLLSFSLSHQRMASDAAHHGSVLLCKGQAKGKEKGLATHHSEERLA